VLCVLRRVRTLSNGTILGPTRADKCRARRLEEVVSDRERVGREQEIDQRLYKYHSRADGRTISTVQEDD